jgi:hypothetical protein
MRALTEYIELYLTGDRYPEVLIKGSNIVGDFVVVRKTMDWQGNQSLITQLLF